jgi:hypothetical protein
MDAYTVTIKIEGDTTDAPKVIDSLKQIADAHEGMSVKVRQSQQAVQQSFQNSASAMTQHVASHTQFVNSLGQTATAMNPMLTSLSSLSSSLVTTTAAMGPFFAGTNQMASGLASAVTNLQQFAGWSDRTKEAHLRLSQAQNEGIISTGRYSSVLQELQQAQARVREGSLALAEAQKAVAVAQQEANTAMARLPSGVQPWIGQKLSPAQAAYGPAAGYQQEMKEAETATSNLSQKQKELSATEKQLAQDTAAVTQLQQLQNSTMATAAGSIAAYAAGIGALIVIITAAVAAYELLKKGIDLVKEAMLAAAKEQDFLRLLTTLSGNAQEAQKQLELLQRFATEAKIFPPEDLRKAAEDWLLMGANIKDVARLTSDTAAAAAAAQVPTSQMADAVRRLGEGYIRMGTGGPATQVLLRQIQEEMAKAGVATADWMNKFRDLTPQERMGIIIKALENAAEANGKFGKSIVDTQNSFSGGLKGISDLWEIFLEKLGKKPDIAFQGILKQISDWIQNVLIPNSDQWGKSIAGALTAMVGGLTTVYKLLGAISDELAKMITWTEIFTRIWDSLRGKTVPTGPAASPEDQGVLAEINRLKQQEQAQGVTPPMAIAPPGVQVQQQGQSAAQGIQAVRNEAKQGAVDLTNFNLGLDRTKKTMKEFGADAKVFVDYWAQYVKIQQYSTDATSRQYHEMQNLEKAIKGLGDPMRDVAKLLPGLSPSEQQRALWLAWREAADRAIKDVETAAKSGSATMAQVFQTGMQKMADSMGTFETNAINIFTRIGDSIATNVGSNLADILDGTKSLSAGFHDMALAIVKDIEKMVIELLIVRPLLNAVGSYFGIGGGATGWYGGQAGYPAGPITPALAAQRGGRVGGSGDGDRVPSLLEPGEFVVSRDAAKQYGYDRLSDINRGFGGEVDTVGMQRGGRRGDYRYIGGTLYFIYPSGEMVAMPYGTGGVGGHRPFDPGSYQFVGSTPGGAPGRPGPITFVSPQARRAFYEAGGGASAARQWPRGAMLFGGRAAQRGTWVHEFAPASPSSAQKESVQRLVTEGCIACRPGDFGTAQGLYWAMQNAYGSATMYVSPDSRTIYVAPTQSTINSVLSGATQASTLNANQEAYIQSLVQTSGQGTTIQNIGVPGEQSLPTGTPVAEVSPPTGMATTPEIVVESTPISVGAITPNVTGPPAVFLDPSAVAGLGIQPGQSFYYPALGQEVTYYPSGTQDIGTLIAPSTAEEMTPPTVSPAELAGMPGAESPYANIPPEEGGAQGFTLGQSYSSFLQAPGELAPTTVTAGPAAQAGGGALTPTQQARIARLVAQSGAGTTISNVGVPVSYDWTTTLGTGSLGVGYGGSSVALGGAGSGTFGPLISPTSQFAQPMGTMGLVYGVSGTPGGNVGGLGGEGGGYSLRMGQYGSPDVWVSPWVGMTLQERQAAWAAAGGGGGGALQGGLGVRALHGGGIVDYWHEYQSGGTVAAGEGVFTPAQMAALAPAAPNITANNTNVSVNVVNNQATTKATGTNAADAKEMARLINVVVQAQISKQQRSGGQLYTPYSARS